MVGVDWILVALVMSCSAPLRDHVQDPDGLDDLLDMLQSGQGQEPLPPAAAEGETSYEEELERLYSEDAAVGRTLDEELEHLLSTVGEEPLEPPENPYREFGSRIVWYRSGFVMKPFTFSPGMGKMAQQLLRDHGGFKVHGTPVGFGPEAGFPTESQPEDSILLHLLEGNEREAFSPPRGPSLAAPQPVPLGDWLLVTAMPGQLRRVERFIGTFLSSVRQIEIESKIVEVVGSKSLDYGIQPLPGTPIFSLPNSGTLVNSIDFSFPNTADDREAVFGMGAVFDGVQFNALLEVVAQDERVSIISRPKVAVREGARADIVNVTKTPFINVPAINSNGTFTTSVAYRDVGVQMYVVPHVVGDSTVVLNIDIEASQQTGTSVALAQGRSVVLLPEISTRKAHTTVRLEPGQAVILGGLITTRKLERERKVPLLGDIPLLGFLFKSYFTENQEINVLFFIRPRILQRSELQQHF